MCPPSHHAGARESLRRPVKPTDSPLGSHLDNIEKRVTEAGRYIYIYLFRFKYECISFSHLKGRRDRRRRAINKIERVVRAECI